jgi:hypothetical protein
MKKKIIKKQKTASEPAIHGSGRRKINVYGDYNLSYKL